MLINTSQKYDIRFLSGTSGRFISTILYGLLEDPNQQIDYPYNSAHEFQIDHQNFFSLGGSGPNWHSYPSEWDDLVKYIIIQIDSDTGGVLAEIARNNLTKNLLWAIKTLVREPDHPISRLESLQVLIKRLEDYYLEAIGKPYTYTSVDQITDDEIKKISWHMIRTITNNVDYKNYKTAPYPESLFFQPLIIKYSDIYQPQGSSWRALDQLCEYTGTTPSAQVLENYGRYVAQRNANLSSIPRLPPQLS